MIASILYTEFNWDDAKEVWQEEVREEERTSFAKMLICDKTPIYKIIKYTGLSHDEINQLIAED